MSVNSDSKIAALREQVRQLQQERDSWRRVAERLEGEKADIQARLASLTEALGEVSSHHDISDGALRFLEAAMNQETNQ